MQLVEMQAVMFDEVSKATRKRKPKGKGLQAEAARQAKAAASASTPEEAAAVVRQPKGGSGVPRNGALKNVNRAMSAAPWIVGAGLAGGAGYYAYRKHQQRQRESEPVGKSLVYMQEVYYG